MGARIAQASSAPRVGSLSERVGPGGREAVGVESGLPGWPILILFGLFPLWWLLGLMPVAAMLAALPMLALLIQSREVRLVPGVLPLVAFAAWCVVCVVMVDSPDRLVGYALRVGQVVAAAILLVYVVNARAVNRRSLVAVLIVVWVTGIVGGYLGMLLPGLRITTPMALVLPGRLLANEYVRDLFAPQLSQVQRPWGSPTEFVRPSAPFAYANSWGAAMAILTPVAVAALGLWRGVAIRLALVVGLALSVPPALATSNRGMFLALGLCLAYGAARLALRGSVLALGALGVGIAAVVAAVLLGGAWESIAQRQLAGNTTEGRLKLYVETIGRTFESPILGYGAPRPSTWSEISVGTQGQVWFVMFSFGFVGLALFLTFLWGSALRTRHAAGSAGIWLHAVLVSTSVLVGFYSLDAIMLPIVVCIAGVLLRERYELVWST